jgi:hypothetical protein
MAFAPGGILWLFDQIHAGIPEAVNSGVVGDAAHLYGYHCARDELPADDYSVQVPEDRAGPGGAASGLDLSWTGGNWQLVVSQRLLDAAGDPRIYPIREFYGTVDGAEVIGYDYYENHPATSDDSHL